MLKDIGVTRIINAVGTTTLTGGSVLSPGVLAAMTEASQVYVDMPDLHRKAGERVAKMLGVEAAYITSGASAALILGLTACMTEGDLGKMRRVPKTEGMRNEVIVQGMHRNMYDRGIELAGCKIVEVGNDEKTSESDFRRAFNDKTAAVVYFVWDPQEGVLPLEKVISIAHEHNVPVITDAAAELPPIENLTRYLKMGSDLAVFSGGKDIAGPNDTGLLLGRKDLVDMAMRLGPHSYEIIDPKLNPYRRTIVFTGRPMKTSKEDVLGLMTALSEYLGTDQGKRIAKYDERVKRMVRALSAQKTAKVSRIWPPYGHPRPLTIPRVELELKTAKAAQALVAGLKQNKPPIYVWNIENKVFINPQCVAEEEDEVIVHRLKQLLR
ncbi:MAG: aminotransferase class V-fold PLP-dependent enzyme [Thaumarchaeota archaeon]|nr:aminotransferase class V-fold PLP-dependent enzyme [Nitrososphaerota archaeon]